MKQRRRNLEILFNYTTIIPIKILGKYRCFFCETKLKDRQQLVDHNETHLPCSTNDNALKGLRGLEWKINVDVSEIKCKVCSEQFKNIDDIEFHLAHKHSLPYDPNITIPFGPYRLIDFKCIVCDKDLKNLRTLTIHMKDEHLEHYECDDCGKKFSQRNFLRSHVIQQHKEEYRCTKCPKSFKSKADYVRHKNEDHIAHCILCFKTFSTSALRFTHMKAEHNVSQGGTCGFCNKNFSSRTGILAHAGLCSVEDRNKTNVDEIVTEVDIDNVTTIKQKMTFVLNNTTLTPFKYTYYMIKCFFCSERFLSSQDFRNHSTTEHADCNVVLKGTNLKYLTVDSSILQCKLCHNQSEDLNTLVAHLETEHEAKLGNCVDKFLPFKLIDDNYPCPQCSDVFSRLYDMFSHYNKAHSASNRVLCLHCGESFCNEDLLQKHLICHQTGEDRFKCTECDRAFINKSRLTFHLGIAHDKKVIKCSHCSEWFVSNHAKMMHVIKEHDGGYVCTYCGVSFGTQHYMAKHVRSVHLKEKNLTCPYCNRAFFDKYGLKKHIRTHTGEKPYSCEYCGKTFVAKQTLTSHMIVHTDEKPFRCQCCDKMFKNRYNLKQHMNIHMPERVFICDYCGKRCSWKQNLRKHMRVHFDNAAQ